MNVYMYDNEGNIEAQMTFSIDEVEYESIPGLTAFECDEIVDNTNDYLIINNTLVKKHDMGVTANSEGIVGEPIVITGESGATVTILSPDDTEVEWTMTDSYLEFTPTMAGLHLITVTKAKCITTRIEVVVEE